MSEIKYGLKDKNVLVTGGSRGIGLEIARYLLAEGATVIICGRKQENLDKAAADLNGGDRLISIQAHVAKEDDLNRLFDSIKKSVPSLDILINNVGMNIFTSSVADSDTAMWQKIVDSNLNGTYLVSRKAAEIMKEQVHGNIINITSVAASKAAPGMGIYGIAKAAIEMMTKVMAAELAIFNIRVNAVSPSMVRTDFSKPFWGNEDFYKEIVKGIPMGRIAEIIEIVHPVLFLASDGAGFITGQTIIVDGGSTTR